MYRRDPKTAQMGKEILPFEMGYLPEYFQKKAEVEINDTPENRSKGLKVFKELLASDESTKGMTFDDDFLLAFLRSRKFNIKRTFKQFKSYLNLRKRFKNVFQNFNFEKLSICTRNKILTFLPYRCQDGCAILILKLDNWIPEEFPLDEAKKILFLYLHQTLRDIMTQVNGFKVIMDVESNPIYHLRHATPSNIYLLYHGTQDCSAVRYKEIHIVNNSVTFKAAWTIFKLFLSPKLRSRMYFHDAPEELLDFFPASVLPVEYGGEIKDYDMTYWLKDIMSPEKLATLGGGRQHIDI